MTGKMTAEIYDACICTRISSDSDGFGTGKDLRGEPVFFDDTLYKQQDFFVRHAVVFLSHVFPLVKEGTISHRLSGREHSIVRLKEKQWRIAPFALALFMEA